MHIIAACQNFNAPLDGTNLHFSKPLLIRLIRFPAAAHGINARSRLKGRR
jgi:hypothetical protein